MAGANTGPGLQVGRLDLDLFANTAAHAARLAGRARAYSQHCAVMRLQASQRSTAGQAPAHPVVSTEDHSRVIASLKDEERRILEEALQMERELRAQRHERAPWMLPAGCAHAMPATPAAAAGELSSAATGRAFSPAHDLPGTDRHGARGADDAGVEGARRTAQVDMQQEQDVFAAEQEKLARLIACCHLDIQQLMSDGADADEGGRSSHESARNPDKEEAEKALLVSRVTKVVQATSTQLAHTLADVNLEVYAFWQHS